MKEKSKKASNSDVENSANEHELSYYIGDRVKLMQEALKLVKSKKLISMAPDCIKNSHLSTVKSLLLEELLGISSKRLRLILAGENFNEESSSSSESEIETKPDIEIISLDDISDDSEINISDDNCMEIQLSERERIEMEIERPKSDKKSKGKCNKSKVRIKKENEGKTKKKHKKKVKVKEEVVEPSSEDPVTVMNVLNLLELQARARAIRSQLASEVLAKQQLSEAATSSQGCSKTPADPPEAHQPSDDENSSSSVIFVSPPHTPVVTVRSDSDTETIRPDQGTPDAQPNQETNSECVTDKNVPDDTVTSPTDEDYNNDVLIVSDETIFDKENETAQQINKETENYEDDSNTWKLRWLESRKVKDVMRTTKLYNTLRQSRKKSASLPRDKEATTSTGPTNDCPTTSVPEISTASTSTEVAPNSDANGVENN